MSSSLVERVIQSAWRRRLLVVTVDRSAIAVVLVLATFVCLLLVGTQILDGRWLILLTFVGLALAAYQVRQKLVDHYRIAQLLDHRLQLADSLSTAWYLHSRAEPDAIAEYQMQGAERVAQTVDVGAAFPFTGKRQWLIAAGLALAAVSLLTVRYLVTNSLTLRSSLIPLPMTEVWEHKETASGEKQRHREQPQGSDEQGQKTAPSTESQKDAKDAPRAQPPALSQGETPTAGQNPNEPSEMREAKEGPDNQSKDQTEGKAGSAQSRPGEQQGDQGDKSAAAKKASADDQANSPQNSNGLVDRMKDALKSLAAKMRPNNQSKQDSSQHSEDSKKGDQQSGSAKDQNSAAQKDAKSESDQQQQASAGQAQGQTQEKARSGQGKTADQSADKSKSDSHSGIGSQDGDKDMKDSEQQKAMGKLAEIIGKRSATATGDVMVENPSGKQHLATDYSKQVGHHSDLGGEINRDEVPLMYQQYVREYMNQVRRQPKQTAQP